MTDVSGNVQLYKQTTGTDDTNHWTWEPAGPGWRPSKWPIQPRLYWCPTCQQYYPSRAHFCPGPTTTYIPTVWTLEEPVTDKELETLDTLVKALAELDTLIEEEGAFERVAAYVESRTGYRLSI